jgi:aminoglycoside phosphotransferase (APT) family kinase protein
MEHWAHGGIVRPVACYAEHLAIVTEQTDGTTLMAYLDGNAAWFPSTSVKRGMTQTLAAVGRWLQQFQSIDGAVGRVSLTGLRDYVDVRLKRLVARGVFSACDRERILRHLFRLGARVSKRELDGVLIHADFGLGNILVAGPRVVVLDFAMVQRGCALHDISRLYLQLDAMRGKPQYRFATVRALQRALLEGFDPTLTAERPLFRFLLMLHRINHLSTLSKARERLRGDVLNGRVRRLHRRWIEEELRRPFTSVADFPQ